MKESITRLSDLVVRMIISIEEEFDELSLSEQKNKMKLKNTITDSLTKLVGLIIKLHKLNKEDGPDENILSSEDLEIIENFLRSEMRSELK